MVLTKLLFTTILLNIFITFSFSILDVKELSSFQYNLDISKNAVLLGQETSGEVITLASKHGQKYQCRFESFSQQSQKEEDDKASKLNVSELLDPISKQPCLVLMYGWWTYEFCYKKQITQYHVENQKVVGEILVLGKYESEFDWKMEEENKRNKAPEIKGRYHTQQYVNGSICDLTNKMRSAEIRFECKENAMDTLVSVDEPTTCQYILRVHTSRVCGHPSLKPLHSKKTLPVTCNPLLNEEDFKKYQEYQEKQKKDEEEEANKLALKLSGGDESNGGRILSNLKENADEVVSIFEMGSSKVKFFVLSYNSLNGDGKDKKENDLSADEKGDKNINEEGKDETQNNVSGEKIDSENKENSGEKANEKPINGFTIESEELKENTGLNINNGKNEQELPRSTTGNKDGNEVSASSLADDNVNPQFNNNDHSTAGLKTDETIVNSEPEGNDQRRLDDKDENDGIDSMETSHDRHLQSKMQDDARKQNNQVEKDGNINEKLNSEQYSNKENEKSDDNQNNSEENKHEEPREKNDDTSITNEDQDAEDAENNKEDDKDSASTTDKNAAEKNENNKEKDEKSDEKNVKMNNDDKADEDMANLEGLIKEEDIVQAGDNYRELKFTPKSKIRLSVLQNLFTKMNSKTEPESSAESEEKHKEDKAEATNNIKQMILSLLKQNEMASKSVKQHEEGEQNYNFNWKVEKKRQKF